MHRTTYASFSDAGLAEQAIDKLIEMGFKSADISLLANESYKDRYMKYRPVTPDTVKPDDIATASDVNVGAATGAGIGLGVGTLAAAAILFIPGAGLAIGAGALASAIGAAATATGTGAVLGGFAGRLKETDMPTDTIGQLDTAIREGAIVIAAHLPSDATDQLAIEQMLRKQGADVVDTYAANKPLEG